MLEKLNKLKLKRNYEIDLHKFTIDLLRSSAAENVVFRHIPNGEKRDPATGAKLKRMGVLAGAADIELVLPPNGQTFCLELKRPGGRQSPSQKAYQLAIEKAGGGYEVAYKPEDVIRTLRRIGALRDVHL